MSSRTERTTRIWPCGGAKTAPSLTCGVFLPPLVGREPCAAPRAAPRAALRGVQCGPREDSTTTVSCMARTLRWSSSGSGGRAGLDGLDLKNFFDEFTTGSGRGITHTVKPGLRKN